MWAQVCASFEQLILMIRVGAFVAARSMSKVSPSRKSRCEYVPGSPFGYWLSGAVRRLFVGHHSLEKRGVVPAVGLATSDNERFVRLWWEAPLRTTDWRPYPKGGQYAKFYQDVHLRVWWRADGAEIKAQGAGPLRERIAIRPKHIVVRTTWTDIPASVSKGLRRSCNASWVHL